jgi:two-component sensor histidine kinase/PAS domain-containing protein
VTERQRILAELAGERARLRAVIDNAPEGIVLADAEGKVLLANPAAERLYAPLAGGPLPGSHEFDSLASLGLRPAAGSPFGAAAQAPLAPRSALNGETLVDQALRIPWPGGEHRDLIANSAPIRDGQGRVTGSVTLFRDVTEQVRAQENLRRFSDRLKILYDIDQAILAAHTPDEIFPPVLQRLAQLVPCCYAGILLSVPDTGLLQLRLGDEQGSHEVLDDVGLTVADLANHRLQQVGNLPSAPYPSPLERLFNDRGLRAYAGAPVQAGNTLLGFLFIGSDEPHSLHPESVQIVGEVARSLALAIQHDLLRTELLRHSEQLAASLREKELMLQEIHHRVKNNLQIISSLLDMEAAGIPDASVAQVLQDSRNRVKVMALIHERLYQSTEVGSVAAPGFVRTIASYLLGMHRPALGPVDLELDVQEVLLDINTAIPLGLILNELVSNALRHAFAAQEGEQGMSFTTPERRDGATSGRGKLRVALAQDGDQMVLAVSDNGVGLPEAVNWQAPSTLGLRLVRVLAEQLRGTVHLDTGPSEGEVGDRREGKVLDRNVLHDAGAHLHCAHTVLRRVQGAQVSRRCDQREGKVLDRNVLDRREGKTFRIAFPWPGHSAPRS